MNISYNWLKDYISFDLSPSQLADVLTSIGLETGNIREIEFIKGGLNGLVIGEVLSCENHPNSDHLYITTVDIGGSDLLQIVCGASNVATGHKVVIATIGTILYSQDRPFTIKKSKIRGIESYGMICTENEIGIGTNQGEIIVLPEEVPVGTLAKDYYRLENDFIFEVDITPNRIDAASHYGIARDLAAYLSFHYSSITAHSAKVDNFKIGDFSPSITVKVKDPFACPRYTGLTIKNVEVKESPQWLKKRLKSIGVCCVNNVVDVTNYVLHETGQPIHAFDLKTIEGNQIVVQTLPEGTQFITLDGQERSLSEKDLMICDKAKGLCIGGVFGGLNSGVTTSTKDLFLESAYFNPTYIRRTARFHGLNTDASFHFERGTDPNYTLQALKRATLLIQEVAGGIVCGDIQDIYLNEIPQSLVTIDMKSVGNLIGKTMSEKDIETILKSLEIAILNKKNGRWILSVPTYRIDVTREADIVEEILRIYGYNRIEITQEIRSTLSPYTTSDRSYELQNILSEQLTGTGFHEIINNSLTSSTYYEDLVAFRKENSILLQNPLSSDLNCMRQTLLFGGLETIAYNSNYKQANLKLYEFGNTYLHTQKKARDKNQLDSIEEEPCLALWMTGYSIVGNWIHPTEETSFFELKSSVENILSRLTITEKRIVYHSLNNDIFSIGLFIQTTSGKSLGSLGILQKNLGQKFRIRNEVYFAELNWSALVEENSHLSVKQKNISKFPSVKRDLALLVDKTTLFSEIETIAYQTDKKILKEVILFDVYEGNNIPVGKKSYAVSFILQDEERTLNEQQIEYTMGLIQKNLEKKLSVQLR